MPCNQPINLFVAPLRGVGDVAQALRSDLRAVSSGFVRGKAFGSPLVFSRMPAVPFKTSAMKLKVIVGWPRSLYLSICSFV
jgi:hypothetical protein